MANIPYFWKDAMGGGCHDSNEEDVKRAREKDERDLKGKGGSGER